MFLFTNENMGLCLYIQLIVPLEHLFGTLENEKIIKKEGMALTKKNLGVLLELVWPIYTRFKRY